LYSDDVIVALHSWIQPGPVHCGNVHCDIFAYPFIFLQYIVAVSLLWLLPFSFRLTSQFFTSHSVLVSCSTNNEIF